MPYKSLREIRSSLSKLHTSDRYVDALLVVEAPDGSEVWRVGGRWDRLLKRYGPGAKPHRARLKVSQVRNADGSPGVAYAIARWLDASRRGDPLRPMEMFAWGDRGSGKTHLAAGFLMTTVALEWPGEYQFGVNLMTEHRSECIEAINEVARPEWIAFQSTDPQHPLTEFVTGSQILWTSGNNPKRLRKAKHRIRSVLLNECQDLQERNYHNAIGALRNTGGLLFGTSNRPQHGAGDWVAVAILAAESGEVGHRREVYQLDARDNDAVARGTLDDIQILQRSVSREAAAADAGGGRMQVAGLLAYPSFRAAPLNKGGNLGDPPEVGRKWRDVTRERTRERMGGGAGFSCIVGADFQKRPGIVGVVCRLYLDEAKQLIYAFDYVTSAGDESAFHEALERKGYSPRASDDNSALLVGDGTGAKQNSAHDPRNPPSFVALKNLGWTVIPPALSRTNRNPCNPDVAESRGQMFALCERQQFIVSPTLREPDELFPSLVESLQRAKNTAHGNPYDNGIARHHHGPDGARYAAYAFMPRPRPSPPRSMGETFEQLLSIKLPGR